MYMYVTVASTSLVALYAYGMIGPYETGFATTKKRVKRGTCRENVLNFVCHTAQNYELRGLCSVLSGEW